MGELHRKPVLFQFGSEYVSSFSRANKRAQKARGRHPQDPGLTTHDSFAGLHGLPGSLGA